MATRTVGGNFTVLESVCWLTRKWGPLLPILTISQTLFERLNPTDTWLRFLGDALPRTLYLRVLTTERKVYGWYRVVVQGSLATSDVCFEGLLPTVHIVSPRTFIEHHPIYRGRPHRSRAPIGFLQVYSDTLRSFWHTPAPTPFMLYPSAQHGEYVCRLDPHRFRLPLHTAAEIHEIITYLLPNWSYLALLADRPGHVFLTRPAHGDVLRPNYRCLLHHCFLPTITMLPSAHFFALPLAQQLATPPEELHVHVQTAYYIFMPFLIYYETTCFCIQAWQPMATPPQQHYEKMLLRMALHAT
jgi:hypothetical protein